MVGSVLSGSLGCHSHVQLSAPAATAPPHERLQAYQQLRPTQVRSVTTVATSGGGLFVSRQVTSLDLASKLRVYHPEDLLPVVPPQSATALAVKDSVTAKNAKLITLFSSLAVMVAGGIPLAVEMATSCGRLRSCQLGGASIGGMIVLSVGALG